MVAKRTRRGTYNRGEVWRGYTFVKNVIPVDVFEEWLSLDFLCVALSRAKAASGVSSEKL